MLREDSNQPFWKEKFINGLPHLFAHKIKEVLVNENNVIEYDNLTYGNIISAIQKEGLKMCIDMKISNQANKDKKKAKYEMGNFCEQYGLPSVAPSKKHKKSRKHEEDRKYKKRFKRFKKRSFEPNDFYKRDKRKPKKRFKNSKTLFRSQKNKILTCINAYIEPKRFHLKDAVLENGNLFEKVHGKSIFQYMDSDPTVNTLFSNAMAAHSGIALKKVLETYKGFEGVSVLVDVAGGFGAALNMIISKYPSIKGINFDLPHVIKQAPSYAGIEHVEGDMFAAVPKGDAIVLKCTCHDWSDESCVSLLKNCNKALEENGKVIIIDYLMPEVPESSVAAKHISVYDNAMVFNLGGKERTEKEFEALSKSSGFSGFQVVCRAYNALGVMELYK